MLTDNKKKEELRKEIGKILKHEVSERLSADRCKTCKQIDDLFALCESIRAEAYWERDKDDKEAKEIEEADEAHRTEAGWCCACGYDMAVLEEKIAKVRAEALKEAIKSLPEELGFEDYDKHMHSYIFEGRGKCEICGLSWKKAGEYEMFNNAIIIMKKRLAVLAKLSKGGNNAKT
jgi:hypothetical protein